MQTILSTLLRPYRLARRYVIADPKDNSVTFSRALYKQIVKRTAEDGGEPKVFTFLLSGSEPKHYAFAVNPDLGGVPAPLAAIQYNDKYRCIGYECLNPAVNRIFYDYRIPPDRAARLSVEVVKLAEGAAAEYCFEILPPMKIWNLKQLIRLWQMK